MLKIQFIQKLKLLIYQRKKLRLTLFKKTKKNESKYILSFFFKVLILWIDFITTIILIIFCKKKKKKKKKFFFAMDEGINLSKTDFSYNSEENSE